MPTYNRPHETLQAISALLRSTCQDFELLVRDDSSDGRTRCLVEKCTDPRVRYHHNPNRLAMPGNLNDGITASIGHFVVVAHDHDIHHPTRIEKMLALFERRPSVIFVHTGLEKIAQDGTPGASLVSDWPEVTRGLDWLRFMLSTFSCPVAADTMVRRSTYETYGLYDPGYGFFSDVEMWMRLSCYGDAGYIPEALVQNREREAHHEYSDVRWDVAQVIQSAHARYLPRAYRGPALLARRLGLLVREDRHLTRLYLSAIKRRDRRARLAGRSYIRQRPVLLARVLARGL